MGIFETDADDLYDALESCNFGPFFSEARYRNLAVRHLRGKFPKATFHTEYRLCSIRADIFVDLNRFWSAGAKVALEFKFNLSTTNEYNRLIGQVMSYQKLAEVEVVIVLCGQTKETLVEQLRKVVGSLDDRKVRILVKPFTARDKNGRFTAATVATQQR